MATIIIDTRSKEAKKMVEFLKETTYARVFEDNIPNKKTIKAMNEVEVGKLNTYKSVKEMIESLNISNQVNFPA